ncbi:hypothetical protein [Bradyrhizobium sp. MOS002]|uniref:hypothetical protein n=1 Tax=Bradyrhizobium sp. MOS002 TaxID=2133947 RepID=UPI000D11AF51|nr:hypothetical protein [Bradyrhizobium sp. MOS002]PSO30534.1 hypothetical protein C7G41_21295 [Bradyrhizobium sp. MOS002]
MSLRFTDPKQIRGRERLLGKPVANSNIVYVDGPRLPRWEWDSAKNGTLAILELDVYQGSLKTYDALRAKRAELEASGKFTPAGIEAEMRKLNELGAANIEKARRSLEEVRGRVAAQMEKMKPGAGNKADDPAHVARKIEARNIMRGMSRRDLLSVLAGSSAEPLYIEAALEADPRALPNMGPTLRQQLQANVMRAAHGPEIEEITEIDRAIAAAARTLDVVTANIEAELKGPMQTRGAA